MHNYDTSQCLYFPGLVHSLEVVGSWQLAPQHFLHEVVEVSSVFFAGKLHRHETPALAERKGRLVDPRLSVSSCGNRLGPEKKPCKLFVGKYPPGN